MFASILINLSVVSEIPECIWPGRFAAFPLPHSALPATLPGTGIQVLKQTRPQTFYQTLNLLVHVYLIFSIKSFY